MNHSSKEKVLDEPLPTKISQIHFGVFTGEDIVKCGVFNVHERALYKMPERTPHTNGVLDRRLGISNKQHVCETCGQKLSECAGHFGYIKLSLPVFHIGFFRNTIQILQCICKQCSRILLPEEERRTWLKKFRSPRLERVQREGLFKKVIERCKRQRACPHCGSYNGVVKKATGALKIIHDVFNKNPGMLEAFKQEELSEAMRHNDGLKQFAGSIADDLNPLRVQKLFEAIIDEDLDVLDVCRPEDLIVSYLSVPPVSIRPSVDMDGASNEDDITMKLMQIIEVNNVLRQGMDKGMPVVNIMENWDYLQVQAAMLINSDLPGLPLQYQQPGRPLRGFVQRLKGKQGRFRGNLSGKRVDFSGRTVISPDPNLQIYEVCVPMHMATVLTYPERVTRHNLEKLRQRVLNGVSQWPGANFVIMQEGAGGQDKVFLKFGDRKKVAAELKPGCIVERHLEDGDVVLFNRQPSLHRLSIQAFKAKVRPGRTLRFNECICGPFNADFDGDEMNIHLPQTEEARAEALHLMSSVNNLCTPKNGELVIHATQDFLTCAFILTAKDRFLTRSEFSLLASSMSDALDQVDIPPPCILKPIELWTGKQLFGILLRPNAKTNIYVNLEMAEKTYGKKGEHMCPNDGYVAFRNSDLLCGRLGKTILGGTKGGLFSTLNSEFSPMSAAACMSRLAKLSSRHMGNMGFSIGIDDVCPKAPLIKAKGETISRGYEECSGYINDYQSGKLSLQAGCNLDETLESQVTGVLNSIREVAGRLCMETLHPHNSPLIMSQCGSKGSPINIAQMVACVGQQSVGGKRAFNGFKDRTLPHFPRGDRTPAGKGFVANSFYSGLTATEFWFHTMGGREGLVDTAVKTAETGYMSRRLMKALEDLYTHYDGTVRNAANGIIQLRYGEDGMDPVLMEGKDGMPVDFHSLLAMVRATTTSREPVPLPSDLRTLIDAKLGSHGLVPIDPKSELPLIEPFPSASTISSSLLYSSLLYSEMFKSQVHRFLHQDVVSQYESARTRLLLDSDEKSKLKSSASSSLSQEALQALEYSCGLHGLTERQLDIFLSKLAFKYGSKAVDPGSTVGAIGAQSIGEPGTQMTLKTFHFAGVASMNITLGVPRIKEIINGSKNISTPIMDVPLISDQDVKTARIVKGRLERTMLGQVARQIKIVFKPGKDRRVDPSQAFISIRLDMSAIESLQLEIDAHSVRRNILAHPRIKLREDSVHVEAVDKITILSPDSHRQELLFSLENLLQILPKVIVKGISTVLRAVINKDKTGKYKLLVEGTNMQAVMATDGVKGVATSTNHVHEIEKFLGIEAARKSIMNEIIYTMGSHGMSIDNRHTQLLADCMTYKGEVLGITRFGIAKMKDSVLHTASFEKTGDHLFDAAIHGRVDKVTGVSESIIMGIPMPTGTGLFKIRQNVPEKIELPQRRQPFLQRKSNQI